MVGKAMGKPKNVVPMTLSVPKELRAKMEAVTVSVNWSAMASAAFAAKLLELQSNREVKGIEDLIARLKSAAELEANQDYQEGRQMGEKWATDKATPRQLRRLQAREDTSKC